MGEVDELDDAIDDGVTDGDQRLQRTQRQPVDDLLEEQLHEHLLRRGRATE
jgi:hypothetical protein